MGDFTTITISYISLQLTALVLLSFFSASHVRQTLLSDPNTKTKSMVSGSFLKSWGKTIWKMRSIYGAFFVHAFDILTDILVIYEWWFKEDGDAEDIAHIDSRAMAYNAIGVMIIYKIISTIAIWQKERNWKRCIYQFMDVLIFQEIYYAHLRIIDEIRKERLLNSNTEVELTVNTENNNNLENIQASEETKDFQIEATYSFKYVRSMEAVFESMPQSILQLVYAMRTSKIEALYVLSVFQAVISMTNSVINADNTQMTSPKLKPYKKKFPPSLPFIKHFSLRLSEVIHRIGVLALIWTVCEGFPFGIVIAFECFMLLGLVIMDYVDNEGQRNKFFIFQSIILMPGDLIFDETTGPYAMCCFDFPCTKCESNPWKIYRLLENVCCSYWIGYLLSAPFTRTGFTNPSLRIGVTFMEMLFMILYAIFYDNGDRLPFLIDPQHGLYVFIVQIVTFLIYSQYQMLFPIFRLPYDIGVLSKYGFAFNGELDELQKIKAPKFPYKSVIGCCGDRRETMIGNEAQFWDETYGGVRNRTCAVLALSNEQYHVVEWLESKGVTSAKAGMKLRCSTVKLCSSK